MYIQNTTNLWSFKTKKKKKNLKISNLIIIIIIILNSYEYFP